MNYEKFLIENKIFPIDNEKGKWNHFKLIHENPQDQENEDEVKRFI